MKKMILLAVLFCFTTAPAAMAQSGTPRVKKSDPLYSLSQNMRDKQLMQDERRRHGMSDMEIDRSKMHVSKDPRVMTEENEIVYKSELPNNLISDLATKKYNNAIGKMIVAEKKKAKAVRRYTRLSEKQNREKAELEQKYAKAESKDLTGKMLIKLDGEKMKLAEKHAKQNVKAQQELAKAIKNCEKAAEEMEWAKKVMKNNKHLVAFAY